MPTLSEKLGHFASDLMAACSLVEDGNALHTQLAHQGWSPEMQTALSARFNETNRAFFVSSSQTYGPREALTRVLAHTFSDAPRKAADLLAMIDAIGGPADAQTFDMTLKVLYPLRRDLEDSVTNFRALLPALPAAHPVAAALRTYESDLLPRLAALTERTEADSQFTSGQCAAIRAAVAGANFYEVHGVERLRPAAPATISL